MSTAKDWTWVVAPNAPTASSRTDDIWFFDEKKGWLINSNGEIRQTLDGGADNWPVRKRIPPKTPGRPYLRCMGWANEKVGWVGAVTHDNAGAKDFLKFLLHRTTDGGATWDPIPNMPENSPAGICGMSVVNEKVMYGAGTNDPNLPGPGLVKTTDGGATWTHTNLRQHADNLIDVRFIDENTGWIVGGKNDPACPPATSGDFRQYRQLKPVVLKTTDGGATWVNKAAGVAGFVCGEWGWKIQWLDATTGFVSLESFSTAAILKTTDGGETWVRIPIVDGSGNPINSDLEGVGFIDAESGWVGGWGHEFEGLFNSVTVDGGKTWAKQDNKPGDPNTDPRIRINRYRFLGDPISIAYCSGRRIYKGTAPHAAPEAVSAPAARVAAPQPAGLALSYVSYVSRRSVEISYVLPHDAKDVFVGIWNHFAFHVKTLVNGESQKAGRHSVVWDGTDDAGSRLGGGMYICRMSVDDQTAESETVRLPE